MTSQLNPIRRPTAMRESETIPSFTKKLSSLQREWLSDSIILSNLKKLDPYSSGNLWNSPESLLLSFGEVPIRGLKGQEPATWLQQRVAQIIGTCRRDSQALVYLIQAEGGQVRVSLGAVPRAQGLALPEVTAAAVRACLPKAQVEQYEGLPQDNPRSIQHLLEPLDSLKVWGMMTGIPALGLFSSTPQSFSPDYILRGMDSDSFAYLVVAEPMVISKIEQALDEAAREIAHIHPQIQAQLGITNTTTESLTRASAPVSWQTNTLGQLAGVTTIAGLLTGSVDTLIATIMMLAQVRYLETQERAQESKTSGSSQERSEGREFLNQSALFYEQALLFHAKRLLLARNQGLWQASVFLAAETPRAFEKLRALVRMTFSQRPSAREIDWNEPIQTVKLPTESEVGQVAKTLSLINLPINEIESATGVPHQLPTLYPYALATPLLTEELAALMNLPQDEYPGYGGIKNLDEASGGGA